MSAFPPCLEPVDDLSPSFWVQEALRDWPAGRFRVRDLIPPVFEAYVRILHRPYKPTDGRIPTGSRAERAAELGRELGPKTNWEELKGPTSDEGQRGDWGPGEGSLIEQEAKTLVSVLSGHTSTPFECWFAMWSGWGDLSGASGDLYRTRGGPIVELKVRWRNRLESWQARREAARLKTFPLLGQSGRSYLLFNGPVDDAARFHLLGHRFQSPAVWWPDDRSWFVHTEIDAMSTYVGGSKTLVDHVAGEQILESFEVEEGDPAFL
jgi:hypothetical protein